MSDDDRNDREGEGEYLENVDQEAMMAAVLQAGLALQDRLERLEVQHGSVGLIFLTDTDAELIKRALEALQREHDPPASDGASIDVAHVNVLIEEMRIFIEGMKHEISREDDEPQPFSGPT